MPTKVGGNQSTGEIAVSPCASMVCVCLSNHIVPGYHFFSQLACSILGVGTTHCKTGLRTYLFSFTAFPSLLVCVLCHKLSTAVRCSGGDSTGYRNSLDNRGAGPGLWPDNRLAGDRRDSDSRDRSPPTVQAARHCPQPSICTS